MEINLHPIRRSALYLILIRKAGGALYGPSMQDHTDKTPVSGYVKKNKPHLACDRISLGFIRP